MIPMLVGALSFGAIVAIVFVVLALIEANGGFEHQKNISDRIFVSKSVGDRITRDASTARVDQVFGSDFDHLPL